MSNVVAELESKIDGLTLRCADLDAKLAEAHAAMMAAQEAARDAELELDDVRTRLEIEENERMHAERGLQLLRAENDGLRARLDRHMAETSGSLIDRARGKIRRWQDAIAAAKRALKG